MSNIQQNNDNGTLEAASKLVSKGIPVLPNVKGYGSQNAAVDETIVRRNWEKDPEAVIAIALGRKPRHSSDVTEPAT